MLRNPILLKLASSELHRAPNLFSVGQGFESDVLWLGQSTDPVVLHSDVTFTLAHLRTICVEHERQMCELRWLEV